MKLRILKHVAVVPVRLLLYCKPQWKNTNEVDGYCLQAEYPTYLECYKVLAAVANEFSGLEKQLNESSKHPREHEKVIVLNDCHYFGRYQVLEYFARSFA